MQDNISPEERLLRLIRKDTKEPSGKQERAAKPPEDPQPKKVTHKAAPHFSFNLISRILLTAFLILGIYLIVDFLVIHPERTEERILMLEEIKGAALEILDKGAGEKQVEPVSYYSEPVKSKNLFSAGPATGKQVPTTTFMEMIAKLRLQGIIASPNPQAVIEDTKTRQVYFLSPGERIGEIELKAILPGKVRLEYHGQEAELSL